MIRNPFTECETSGAKITSRFWHVEAKNAAQAKRIAEIIRARDDDNAIDEAIVRYITANLIAATEGEKE